MKSLAYFVNISFEIGVLPSMLKYGNLLPVSKGGEIGCLKRQSVIKLLGISRVYIFLD